MINNIQKDVDAVIKYSQGINDVDTTELLQKWAIAKEPFISAFGDKPIIEWPEKLHFPLGETDKKQMFDSFLKNVTSGIVTNWLKANEEGFFDNKTTYDYVNDTLGITIEKGRKMSKALKLFYEWNILTRDEVIDLQTKYSMLIQQNVVTGTLCLSVHPLDFLSLSENTHNWRSCHALDGDYRSGNLAYITDKCTLIAYIKSDDETKLPHFPDSVPWNNKKWRCLFFFDRTNKLIWAGRPYPFSLESVFKPITKMFQSYSYFDVNSLPKWGAGIADWSDVIERLTPEGVLLNHDYFEYERDLYRVDDFVVNHEEAYNYNDVLYSSVTKPKVMCYGWGRSYYGKDRPTPLIIGNTCRCVACNKENVYDSDTFLGKNCIVKYGVPHEDFYECGECGCLVHEDDSYYVEERDFNICKDCASKYYDTCGNCGQFFSNDDLIYDEDLGTYFCPECYDIMDDKWAER